MNCKPNDIAIMCRAGVQEVNRGIFVRVLELDSADNSWTFEDASRPVQMYSHGRPTGAFRASAEVGGNAWIFDEELLPLRDNPGADESLSWSDTPIPAEVA